MEATAYDKKEIKYLCRTQIKDVSSEYPSYQILYALSFIFNSIAETNNFMK